MNYAETVTQYENEGLTTSDAQACADADAFQEASCFTATYSPDDNKLRISCTRRIDSDTFARIKTAGYKWAPKQELFVAPMWTPSREDLAIELAGFIGDDDASLIDRATERAERFDNYSDKRASEAESTRAHVDSIAGGIPFGQPILVGHHSQRRAERDAKKIENGMHKAVKLWETSQYWQQRAEGAIAHAKYKELPAVRARRIKGIEADKRKMEKETREREKIIALWNDPAYELTMERALAITNHSAGYLSFCFTLDKYPRNANASQYEGPQSLWSALEGGIISPQQAKDLTIKAYTSGNANRARWIAHYDNRLTYEKAMLNEQGAIDLIIKKPRPAQLPLVNYKQESFTIPCRWRKGEMETLPQIELTSEQYKQINPDSRGTREVDNSHRIRIAHITFKEDGTIARWPSHKAVAHAVFLTDSKTHKKPEPMEKAVVAAPSPTFQPKEPKAVDPRAAQFEQLKDAASKGVTVATGSELFPTPPELADRMAYELNIQPGNSVLEPSAGTGALIDAIERIGLHGYSVAVEQAPALAQALSNKALGWTVKAGDFLTFTPSDLLRFDRIAMNPPFSGGQDVEHVTHALSFLNPGGRVVAVMSAGVLFKSDRKTTAFRELVEAMGGVIEPLPANTFKTSGTGVNTVLVTIDA